MELSSEDQRDELLEKSSIPLEDDEQPVWMKPDLTKMRGTRISEKKSTTTTRPSQPTSRARTTGELPDPRVSNEKSRFGRGLNSGEVLGESLPRVGLDKMILTILFLNTQSINLKVDELKAKANILSTDLITATESLTNLTHTTAYLSFDNYSLVMRQDRQVKGGGGIL